jgi:hypothetical protein
MENVMLRKAMIVAAAVALSIGVLATESFARGGGAHGGGVGRGFSGARGGNAGELLLTKPAAPQFNNPGSQLVLPRSGNPVQQLSPLGSAGQPDSLGIR